MRSRQSVRTYQGNELTRHLSGNARPQAFKLAEPPWTDSALKSEIVVRQLISTLKNKKKQTGTALLNLPPPIPACEKKATTIMTYLRGFVNILAKKWGCLLGTASSHIWHH